MWMDNWVKKKLYSAIEIKRGCHLHYKGYCLSNLSPRKS